MLCGLGKEERTKFRKQKMEKEKNSMRLKVLVVMKEYLTTYNHVRCEIFFAVLEPFLNKIAFYTKLLK